MADVVSKVCDFKLTRRDKQVSCGMPVPNNEPTPLTIATTRYLMDLCEKHQELLQDAVEPFVSVAHDAQKRTGTHVRQALRGRTGQAFTTKDVRSWLMSQGEDVPHAGRLSNEQIKRYEEAHGL